MPVTGIPSKLATATVTLVSEELWEPPEMQEGK